MYSLKKRYFIQIFDSSENYNKFTIQFLFDCKYAVLLTEILQKSWTRAILHIKSSNLKTKRNN